VVCPHENSSKCRHVKTARPVVLRMITNSDQIGLQSMPTSKHATPLQVISVRPWRDRLAIFDPSMQPADSSGLLLYFVDGHKFCRMSRDFNVVDLVDVSDSALRELALNQYEKWRSLPENSVKSQFNRVSDEPPPPRRKCQDCEGGGTWYDAHNKATYGVISEGPNIREVCRNCNGAGYVDDLL